MGGWGGDWLGAGVCSSVGGWPGVASFNVRSSYMVYMSVS